MLEVRETGGVEDEDDIDIYDADRTITLSEWCSLDGTPRYTFSVHASPGETR
jgi:hypothetical protein